MIEKENPSWVVPAEEATTRGHQQEVIEDYEQEEATEDCDRKEVIRDRQLIRSGNCTRRSRKQCQHESIIGLRFFKEERIRESLKKPDIWSTLSMHGGNLVLVWWLLLMRLRTLVILKPYKD